MCRDWLRLNYDDNVDAYQASSEARRKASATTLVCRPWLPDKLQPALPTSSCLCFFVSSPTAKSLLESTKGLLFGFYADGYLASESPRGLSKAAASTLLTASSDARVTPYGRNKINSRVRAEKREDTTDTPFVHSRYAYVH